MREGDRREVPPNPYPPLVLSPFSPSPHPQYPLIAPFPQLVVVERDEGEGGYWAKK